MASRRELPLSQKVSLIRESAGKSQRQLADIFEISKSQVQSVLKRKSEYLTAYEDPATPNDRKRLKIDSRYQDIDTLTWRWFQRVRSANIPVSGPMLQQKAKEFASSPAVNDNRFRGSNGWLVRFKARHTIDTGDMAGESDAVNEDATRRWQENVKETVAGYSRRDVYSVGESGILYRALPDGRLGVRGSACKGGQKANERLTVLFCVNMEGEFERTVVIGHAVRPSCFKNLDVDSLPVQWESNKRAWMTSQLFTQWATAFNMQMKMQERHVLLLLDNAPCHPHLDLSNVKLVFLPPDATVVQPFDRGIIKCIKAKYRSRLLRAVLSKLDEGEDTSSISKCVTVLDACHWIDASVKEVTPETVRACFSNAGVFISDLDVRVPDCLGNLEDLVRETQLLFGFSDENHTDYNACDDDVPVCDDRVEGLEDQLIEELQMEKHGHDQTQSRDDVEGDDNEIVESVVNSSIQSVRESLMYVEQLKLFFLERNFKECYAHIMDIQENLHQHSLDFC